MESDPAYLYFKANLNKAQEFFNNVEGMVHWMNEELEKEHIEPASLEEVESTRNHLSEVDSII